MKRNKKQNAITLIALVITIVVLLILAGVTIASITGENGILTKVQMAKINTEEAEKEEMEKFNKLEEEMHGNITGELFLQYDIEYSVNKEYAKIMVYPRIGGIPRLQTYEEYINPKKELEGKSYDEKKEIFFNYEREYNKEYYEETYPGQEITEELILSDYDVSTIDELCQNNGVESIDEYIIKKQIIGRKEYNEYYDNYQESYSENITIINPKGESNVITIGTGYEYIVTSDGVYNFIAQYNNQETNKDIQVNGLASAKEMEIAKENKDTYVISTIEDLVKLSINVNNGIDYQGKTLKLINNLDFSNTSSYANANDKKTFGDYNGDGVIEGIKDEILKEDVGGIKIIGTTKYIDYYNLEYSFKGVFEGNNKIISNLFVNEKESFFNKNEGNIQNITIKGKNSGICNYNYGTISGCVNASEIQQSGSSGIAGRNFGIIKETINKANIVLPDEDIMGGITSNNYGVIERCINEGTIEGGQDVGGIAGDNSKGTISKCYNTADIKAQREVAGICGWNCSIIEECYNIGNISSEKYHTGGIAGRNQYGTEIIVKNCYNTGNIIAPNSLYVGGVIGSMNVQNGKILNSYNIGNISGKKGYTGAIAGAITNSSILNCVYSKESYSGICDQKNQGITIKNNKEDSLENLKGNSMLEILKSDNNDDIWIEDNKNINNQYPILKWQGE